jgi:hypothetical protein
MRVFDGGSNYMAGAATNSMASSTWTVGRIGAALPLPSNLALNAQANLGRGSASGTGFGYVTLEGVLLYKASSRLYLTIGDQYLKVGPTHGHLIKGGTFFVPFRRLLVDITYAQSAGGNLDTQFISSRLDLAVTPRVRVLAGGAFGESAPALFQLDVGMLRNDQDVEGKRTLTLIFKIPLGNSQGDR